MSARWICWGLLASSTVTGCNDPVRQRDDELSIEGYTITGQASETEAGTGETLTCLFFIDLRFDEGRPLIGTWTDVATIKVTRMRTSPTHGVTYDTTITGQELTLTVPDSTHIQLAVTGPFSKNLAGDMISAYPGSGQGEWTCGPLDPLARVQPGVVLEGQFQTTPFINIPIE